MTTPRGGKKPKKPYPDFPLTPHDNGQFCKRIRGKLHYFGPWASPDKALELYLEQRDDLYHGREPKKLGAATVGLLVDSFFTHKTRQMEQGEIVPLTLEAYKRTCLRVAEVLGATWELTDLHPADFERLRASWAATNGPRALCVYVQHVRTLFRYALEAGLIDAPVRFGPGFRRPSAATIRKLRASKPARLFTAAELRQIVAAAPVQLKAMVLLGINCGFGNADCEAMPLSALDLDAKTQKPDKNMHGNMHGWVNYPRPKTGINRRCKLWPETVRALRAALKVRPEPRTPRAEKLVFLAPGGAPYNGSGGEKESGIGDMFRHLLRRLGLKRPGLSYYACRHTFATIAGGCRDQVAVNAIMGHVDNTQAAAYREGIEDGRLVAVASHVRRWLYGK